MTFHELNAARNMVREIFPNDVEIFEPEQWLSSDNSQMLFSHRAAECAENLLEINGIKSSAKILSISSNDVYDIGGLYLGCSPIEEMQNTIPEGQCASIGSRSISNKVPNIKGSAESAISDVRIKDIEDFFGGNPHIIYAKDIFKESDNYNDLREKELNLEFCAELLKNGGYLIIDNTIPNFGEVLKSDFLHARHLKLDKVYYYNATEGLYVFTYSEGIDSESKIDLQQIAVKDETEDILDKDKKSFFLSQINQYKKDIKKYIDLKEKVAPDLFIARRKIALLVNRIDKKSDQISNLTNGNLENKEAILQILNRDIQVLNIQLLRWKDKYDQSFHVVVKSDERIKDLEIQIFNWRSLT